MSRHWITINLLFLLIVATLGSLMRGSFTGAVTGLNYDYVLHTHSHTAFIAWLYQSLFVALVTAFIPADRIQRSRYALQLALTQLLAAGMLYSFWTQGYGILSIALSSVFQLLSYVFIWRLWRDGKHHWQDGHRYSWRLVEIALATFFLSTFGPWGLAVIMANGLQSTPYYNMAIYFYLHFQYNGWFLFALLGLLFYSLERGEIRIEGPLPGLGFVLLAVGVFPAYALSIVTLAPSTLVYSMGIAGGVIQLAGALLLVAWFGKAGQRLKQTFREPWIRLLLGFSGVVLFSKFLLQLLSIVPGLDAIAFHNRYVIIAYIHWVLLGGVTFALLGLLAHQSLLHLQGWLAKTGIVILLAGFLLTEWLLVSPVFGFFVAGMFSWLFAAGIAMAAGISLVVVAQLTFRQA